MKLSEIRTMYDSLLTYDLDDYDGESASNAQKDAKLNRALRVISKEIFIFDPSVRFKLTAGVQRYSLDDTDIVGKRVVRPFYVTIDGNKLWNFKYDGYGLWGYQEFVQQHPKWEADSNGTPTKAVVYGGREILVHLPPTAAIAGKTTNYIGGQVLADDLVDDDDIPQLPIEMHEAVAILGSIFAATPTVSAKEGLIRLAAQDKEWRALAKTARNENMRLYHSGSVTNYEYADHIRM